MANRSRFVDYDLDWLGPEEKPDDVERSFDESKHPRDSSGKWTDSGEGSAGESEGAEAFTSMGGKTGGDKVKSVTDFAKEDVGVYYGTGSEQQKLFIDTWNKYVDKSPAEFKKEFLGNNAVKATMNVHFNPSNYEGTAIQIKSTLQGEHGEYLGRMDATIYPESNRVHMDYYQLEDNVQSHGVMKSVMAHEMKMWEDMGVTKVDMLANLEVGGYAWGRYGFVPENASTWRSLASDLQNDIERYSEGGSGGGGEATSWEELTSDQQDDIENAFYDDTMEEFVDSEVTSWREGGEPLEIAKSSLADEFNTGQDIDWATDVVQGYLKERSDAGEPVPFTVNNIIDAIKMDYSSRHGDGRGDFEVTFNESDLEPTTAGATLTEKAQADITNLLERHFDTRAEGNANDLDPPDHLTEAAREYQRDHWGDMSERARFQWAESNRSDVLSSGEGRQTEGTGEIPQAEADSLLKLTRSPDPRALWAIADSKWGKRLLLGKDWNGKFIMDDSDQTTRFHAYVEKAK